MTTIIIKTFRKLKYFRNKNNIIAPKSLNNKNFAFIIINCKFLQLKHLQYKLLRVNFLQLNSNL